MSVINSVIIVNWKHEIHFWESAPHTAKAINNDSGCALLWEKTRFKPALLPASGSAQLPGSLFSFDLRELWILVWISATPDCGCQVLQNTLTGLATEPRLTKMSFCRGNPCQPHVYMSCYVHTAWAELGYRAVQRMGMGGKEAGVRLYSFQAPSHSLPRNSEPRGGSSSQQNITALLSSPALRSLP